MNKCQVKKKKNINLIFIKIFFFAVNIKIIYKLRITSSGSENLLIFIELFFNIFAF